LPRKTKVSNKSTLAYSCREKGNRTRNLQGACSKHLKRFLLAKGRKNDFGEEKSKRRKVLVLDGPLLQKTRGKRQKSHESE